MKKADLHYYVTSYFRSYLPGQKNLSGNTVSGYADAFRLLFRFCEEKKGLRVDRLKISDFDSGLVCGFLDWLETERGCSVSTRNQRLTALHSFFRYLQKQSPPDMEAIQGILDIPYKKTAMAVVPYLSEDQMKILLSMPDAGKKEGFRDQVLLSLLYDTGARVQELADLKVKDIRTESLAVVTLHGKGNKTRQVPVMTKTRKLLETYLEHYRYDPGISRGDNQLFTNQKKGKLSRWGISYIINKYVEKAKAEKLLDIDFPVTPHVFRHSKAVHMVRAGINLIYIRDFLGHVDCSTTEIYARIDTESKRKAIEKACKDILPEQEYKDWTTDTDLMAFLESLTKG